MDTALSVAAIILANTREEHLLIMRQVSLKQKSNVTFLSNPEKFHPLQKNKSWLRMKLCLSPFHMNLVVVQDP
jgi:hypothetical protein